MNPTLLTGALLLAAALLHPAVAQTPAAALPALEGRTMEGKPFQLASLRGKVVLVMFWSTDCAVCRDKMSELRQNYEGWAGKPFELLLVSVDRKLADLADYERIISRTVPLRQRFPQVWAGEPNYRDTFARQGALPTTFLLDKQGAVVERWQGRMPPEAWDRVAELL